jgi:hypothetical protein
MAQWKVPKIWEEECWIIGGGPSVSRQFGMPEEEIKRLENVNDKEFGPEKLSEYMKPIHHKNVIGVNNAFMIGDWIDVFFFGDCDTHLWYRKKIAKFPGLKVTCCPKFQNRKDSEDIKYLKKIAKPNKRYGISEDPEAVCWNQNSGSAAISLATLLGSKRIILLGFDMSLNEKGTSHWHGYHVPEDKRRRPDNKAKRRKNLPYERHKRGFPMIKSDADRLGIEIINASPNSTIKEFKKMTVKDILNEN